jgi:osmotically-inducible protein OsmY
MCSSVFLVIVFSGCASITGRTAGEIIDDNVIVTEINAKIIAEPELSYWKIDVNSKDGNVVLTGFVTSKAAEEKAIAIAKSVTGVKSVKNLLKIQEKK